MELALKTLTITHPIRAFSVTWLGLVVSWFGSGLTNFAIGTHLYQSTGSTTQYSLFNFFYFVPMLVMTPVSGALVDRWDRRWAMLLADIGGAVASLLLCALVFLSDAGLWRLELWHFFIPIALGSTFSATHLPAYYAATSLLVPKEHLGRANGMIELAFGAGQILSPLAAGFLLGHVGLKGMVLIDVASFAFSITTLLIVRFPAPPPPGAEQLAQRKSLLRETAEGWRFIRERPGLVHLTAFFALLNLSTGMVIVLITPLVLSFANVSTLGMVMSFAGVGMVVGAVVMSMWGGPKRRIHGVLGFYLLSALALLAASLPPSAPVVAGGAFVYLMCSPLVLSPMQAIWQSKVPAGLQGRVFSVRRMITLAAPPLAALLSGPLSDRVCEPLLAPGGALANSVGRVIGVGPGRGVALIFVVLGLLIITHTLLSLLSPRIRNVEDELPDALAEQDTAPQPAPAASVSPAL